MKTAVIYYSYSGNTRMVASVLADFFKHKGGVEELELIALDESDSFFVQAMRAFWHKHARIEKANFDLRDFDVICLGTPVWAFGPAPAMNTYLDSCFGVRGKEIIFFTTYGSGTGNEHCLNYMQDKLAQKGGQDFKRFSIQQNKIGDKEFVLAKIKEITPL
jgi:flavodoxin